MALDVKSVWCGALTASSVRVVADTAPPTNGSLLVADNEAMTGATTIGPVTATAEGILNFSVTGLDPDTRYWYVVDAGGLNVSYKGTFRTHPGPVGEPASYIFGAAGDAGLTGDGDEGTVTNGVSNSAVFPTMTAQAAAEDWTWFSHLGDLHYRNISTNTPADFRAAYDDNHNYNLGFNPGARQGTFLRGQAVTYVWDDHDFGANNSNRTSASNPAANSVYRECVPHYPLPGGTTGIYQSWQVGRVLYIASDVRSFRDPNSDPLTPTKTLLGTGQKAWMEALLSTARNHGAEALVWQTPSRWVGSDDTWSEFAYERDEMVQLFGDTGWLDRMILMTADMHALSICTGPHNPHGAFPMFMFAGMDAGAWSTSETDYDIGSVAGRRQYGTMRVQDNGHTIALTGTGYRDGTVMMSHTAYVHVGNPAIALSHAAGHVSEPFTPTDDDQKVRNLITARRTDGGEYTYSKTIGPYNTGDPADSADAVGEYDEGAEVNVATDEQLPDQASWRVALSTVDEDRFPIVHIDLAKNPGLVDQVAGLYVGDRLTISSPPPQLAPDTIEIIAEGGTETIGHPNHLDVELNASPGRPWLVAQLASPATLVHATFETDLDGFTSQGGATIARVASPGVPPFGGAWSCQITPDGVTASGGARGDLTGVGTVIPGNAYTVWCWVYSPAGWSDLRAVIDWYDSGGTFLSTGLGSAVVVPAAQWTLLSGTFTAPASASQLRARARHDGTPAASAIWYTDEVIVKEVTPTSLGAGTNQPNRWDTSESQLVNAVTASDTELIVHTVQDGIFARAPWINSQGLTGVYPTHFPLDLKLGGETVRAAAIKPLGYDTFTRTVAAGSWGTGDGGQAWTLTGGTNSERSVDGSRGLVTLPSSPTTVRFQVLPTSVGDCEIKTRLSVSQVATGASLVPGILLRYTGTSNYYRARIHFSTGGTMFVSVTRDGTIIGSQPQLPYTYAANDEFELRARLIGHRVLMKVWRVGTWEPERWHHDVTITTSTIAAGQVGVTASAFSGNTNVSPVCRFDQFEVITPQRATVQRSINTVVKAQAAGVAVSLAQPAPVAL